MNSTRTRGSRTPRIRAVAFVLLGVLALSALAGCAQAPSAGGRNLISRSYGTPDPCQRTLLPLEPKAGVDLAEQGEKIVGAYEGIAGIADVTLDPRNESIEVTWCVSQQSEQGVVRAVALTDLVTPGTPQTQPN